MEIDGELERVEEDQKSMKMTGGNRRNWLMMPMIIIILMRVYLCTYFIRFFQLFVPIVCASLLLLTLCVASPNGFK